MIFKSWKFKSVIKKKYLLSIYGAEKCEFPSKVCSEIFLFLYFMRFYMCCILENLLLFSIVAFLLTEFMFDVVGELIADTLVYQSKFMKLSKAFAGVTLKALAIWTDDFLTTKVISFFSEGLSYNIGALLRAKIFIIIVVLFHHCCYFCHHWCSLLY